MNKPYRVLLCPLDWGIGHASRCVPVIHNLRKLGFQVVVAASGRPLEFLRKEFPDIPCIDFPGMTVTYPNNARMALRMFLWIPKLLTGIWREHKALKKTALHAGASLIISDNRYGCWHATIPSIFMTHQLDIQVPATLRWAKGLLKFVNYWFINKYDECWIPDFEPHLGLAGVLSHPPKLPRNTHYIGILSRFSDNPFPAGELSAHRFDLLVMLSGPEPQRTILEEKILRQLVNINLQVAVVRGLPEFSETYVLDGRIHVFSHLETGKMKELIANSNLVICRSGYSSIMDLVTLGKRAIFIPTPGQTEQEYLSRYLMKKKIYFSMAQDHFELLYAIEMSKNFPGMVIQNDHVLLISRLKEAEIRQQGSFSGHDR